MYLFVFFLHSQPPWVTGLMGVVVVIVKFPPLTMKTNLTWLKQKCSQTWWGDTSKVHSSYVSSSSPISFLTSEQQATKSDAPLPRVTKRKGSASYGNLAGLYYRARFCSTFTEERIKWKHDKLATSSLPIYQASVMSVEWYICT